MKARERMAKDCKGVSTFIGERLTRGFTAVPFVTVDIYGGRPKSRRGASRSGSVAR